MREGGREGKGREGKGREGKGREGGRKGEEGGRGGRKRREGEEGGRGGRERREGEEGGREKGKGGMEGGSEGYTLVCPLVFLYPTLVEPSEDSL